MTTPPRTDRERAEDEAAAWLVRLSERPDDDVVRARFEAWRTQDPLNADIWARTARAYHLVGQAPPHHRDQWQVYATTRAADRPPRPVRRRRRAMGLAAALAACLVIAAAPQVLLRLEADMVTGTAELVTTMLDDGTRLHLAPESAVDVAFADRVRQVRLLKGEAFFEVAPDPSRPFRVTAGNTAATVLGTAFEGLRGKDGVTFAVQHGRLQVTDDTPSPAVSERLEAGQWLRVTPHDATTRGTVGPDDVAAWRRGELVARDRPAGEIVAVLRRYHTGTIVVHDAAFAERRVSGLYDLRDPATTLRDLAASHGAVVRQLSPWLLIVTAR